MRKIFSFFLFQKRPEKNAAWFWVWNIFMVCASGFGIGLLSLVLAYGNYDQGMFRGYFSDWRIILFNALPCVLLAVFFYGLIGRAWIAFLAACVPVIGASVGNYYKLVFRDDPFTPADVSDIFIGIKFGNQYGLFINTRLIVSIVASILIAVFLALFVRGRPKARFRLPAAAAAVILIFPLKSLYNSDSIYNDIENFDYEEASVWSSTQQYISRGFVYPFLHGIEDAIPHKPDGYSEKAAEEILAQYAPEDIPQDKKINFIGIQLEAFNDFERLGVPYISDGVYEKFHAIEAESYTGALVTNIFAGGTVDTERSFLTGDYKLDDFRRDTGSYVRYFSSQGYVTEGGHPCYDWFYNRKNINRYIGFDNYWFHENRYGAIYDFPTAPDDIFIPDILTLYRQRDKTKPYFNFSVTYQGHGPYYTDSLYNGCDGSWNGDKSDPETYYILNNYLGLTKNTWDDLDDLINALRDDPDPVVLVLFGDHNPWLGNSNSVYKAMGIDLDTSTDAGFYNYYSTRYLIWLNDAAKDVVGGDIAGEGPAVSPCYLMNVVFEKCGFGKGSAYMQLMGDMMEKTPVFSSMGYYLENGSVTREPSPELQKEINRIDIVQYYRKRNAEY